MGTHFPVRTQRKIGGQTDTYKELKALFLAQLEREAVVTRKAKGIAGHNGRPLGDALALCNGRQVAV